MSYTALDRMREKNLAKYGINGPVTPEPFDSIRVWEKDEKGKMKKDKSNLPVTDFEKKVVHFIRENCEELRFSKDERHIQLDDLDGSSLKDNQIPLNMEKDLDRRCLEVAIHRFMESGSANDAFDVYFCYLEMFIGKYGQSKKMIEMLSEFETNASSLLMKHRDHYSHSVYVFLIGIAIFEESEEFRNAYKRCYSERMKEESLNPECIHDLSAHFIKYWGLASLFHDIGYPFELSFDQVKSYFGGTIKGVPFVQFAMNSYNEKKSEVDINKLKKLLKEDTVSGDLNEYFAKALFSILGNDYQKSDEDYTEYLMKVLRNKPSHPESFGGFIDHAYFSALLLTDNLLEIIDEKSMYSMYTESIMAIILHNSLYKFSITNVNEAINDGKHFTLDRSPLSYLLMLCDELQCWDRTSYGQQSRGEVHPYDCHLEFTGNKIKATYVFDPVYANSDLTGLNDYYRSVKGTYKKLIKADNGKSSFLSDIENIISINGDSSFGHSNRLELETDSIFENNKRVRRAYLSSSNYIHLFKFAVMVHQMNHLDEFTVDEMFEKFNSMSLEYKINHLSRAKKYARILNQVGCFYSDRPLDMELVTEFGDELNDILGATEHERWCFEHWVMGWRHGLLYKNPEVRNDINETVLRECTKTHIDMPEAENGEYSTELGLKHYDDLTVEQGHSADAKEKDLRSINNLLKILRREDGIKVYRIQ